MAERPRYLLPAGVLRSARVKVRDEGFVRNKAIYIALGVLPDGARRFLASGSRTDRGGAKFWLRVVNELKSRGVQDILIAVVDTA